MRKKALLAGAIIIGLVLSFTVTIERSGPEPKRQTSTALPQQKGKNLNVKIAPNTARAETDVHLDPKDIHYQDEIAVLTYHNIDQQESAYTISPARFHDQMQALKKNHYNVIPMEEFINYLNGKGEVPPNAVVLTFDDGYESVYRYAYPELKQDGYSATTFLIVSYVGTGNPSLPFLNWNEIQEMKQNGFSFYSHTYNLHEMKPDGKGKDVPEVANRIFLPDKNRLETEAEYDTSVKTDLDLAEKILKEKLGNTFSMLCFPHGAYNTTLINIAEKEGIHYFFTGREGINTRKFRNILRIEAGAPVVSAESLIQKLNYFHLKPRMKKRAQLELHGKQMGIQTGKMKAEHSKKRS